jgi:hypothetical protein
VAEAAGALAGGRVDVEDDVVIVPGVGADCGSDAARDFVHVERVAHPPGDVVVGAGGVTAQADRADDLAGGDVVQREPAAEDVDPARLLPTM